MCFRLATAHKNSGVIPAQAGIQAWTPASAGVTVGRTRAMDYGAQLLGAEGVTQIVNHRVTKIGKETCRRRPAKNPGGQGSPHKWLKNFGLLVRSGKNRERRAVALKLPACESDGHPGNTIHDSDRPLETLMFDALMLMVYVLPKMLRAKMASITVIEDREARLSDKTEFIRNNHCPIPAASDLPIRG